MRASPKDTMKKKDSAESSARVTPLEADTPDVEIVSPEPEEDDDILDPLDDDMADGGEVLDVEDGQTLPAPAGTTLPSPSGGRDSLHLYLREISRFPLLKPEEEHELAVRVRDHNDPDAAFRLVSSHLRLVVRIAMDFQRRWMQNVLDLVQEGNVGLMRAVNKFDPDKGIKFSYYASFWIKAYILKFIMDNWRMVKIGTTQAQRKLFYNLNRERQKLIAQGYDPDSSLLSERLGVSEDQVTEMEQRLSSNDLSLNAQVGDDPAGATRMDFLPALGPGIEDSLATDEIADLLREIGAPPQVWLEGAVWLMTRGTPAVLPFTQEAVTACGDNVSLNLIYAEALAANGLNEKALQLMRDYLQRHPDAMDARLELALLLVKCSRFEEAEQLLLAIKGKERTPMVEYYHARALIGMKRNDEAIERLKAAIREKPAFTEAKLELAYLYERRSEYEKARALYEQLLNRNVSPDKIVLRLISLSLRMKQPEKALSYMKYGPDNDAFRITAAGLFMEERHYLQAEGLLKQVAASGKATADVYLLLADLSFEQRRNLAQACQWLDKVPAEEGDRALLLRAQLYAQDNQWDQAIGFLRQGITAYPDKPIFGLMEIRMLYSRDRKDEAWKAAEQAVKRWPADEDIAFIYGSLLDEQGKKKEALAVMEQIILDHPRSHAALNYVGYTLAEQGRDLDRALETSTKP